MTTRKGDWIQTYTGRMFWPLDPRPEEVCLKDIAHALAIQNRFGGHSLVPYSVAQHSVMVSRWCDLTDARWGLLHDAAEAYLNDVCRPVKVHPDMAPYRAGEALLMSVICERFGLPPLEPPSVQRADRLMLLAEKRDLLAPEPAPWGVAQGDFAGLRDGDLPARIEPWSWRDAEYAFLARWDDLTADF
jgi:hypothetical protein